MLTVMGRISRSEIAAMTAAGIAIAGYALLMLWKPHLGPLDDHELAATIQQHFWLKPFVIPAEGRFFPLNGQELNLISVFSTQPLSYYLFNTVEFLCFSFLFCSLLSRFANRTAVTLALLALLLTPGFAEAWLRLLVPERDQMLALTAFLYCYCRQEKPSRGMFITALLCANYTLYSKEPDFILLGTFAAVRLATAARRSTTKLLDAAILISCGVYVVVYYYFVYRHHVHLYNGGLQADGPLSSRFKAFVSFSLNDPLLVFIGLPMAAWRLFAISVRRSRPLPLADALLAGGVAYMAAYIAIDLVAPRYWQPVYVFLIPAFFMYGFGGLYIPRKLMLRCTAVAAILLLSSAAPNTAALIASEKYIPKNYNTLLAILVPALSSPHREHPIRLFVDRVGASDIEIPVSLQRFLEAAGVSSANYKIIATDETGAQNLYTNGRLQKIETIAPRSGDYLIETPYPQGAAPSNVPKVGYVLVWRSQSPWAVPALGIYSLAKYGTGRLTHRANALEAFSRPVDYFLFRRR